MMSEAVFILLILLYKVWAVVFKNIKYKKNINIFISIYYV